MGMAMPLLPNSGLEKPATGAPNTSAIISGNFEVLETWIDPATPTTDDGYDAIRRGLTKGTVNPLTPAASVAIDFDGPPFKSIALTQATTFTFTNVGAAKIALLRVTNDGFNYAMTWPASVVWLGTAPTISTASKTGLVELWATGASEVLARWTEGA